MRRAFLLCGLATLSLGVVHCVGDEPSDGGGSQASTDASVTGDGTSSDGSSQNDGSSSDTDSGPVDSCIGHTDCPNNVEAANLQLWLRGDLGASCVGGRLASWNDQSGKGNHAHPGTIYDGAVALAPQCGTTKINGHDVVTFTAPAPAPAGSYTQYADETLDVDLDFAGSSDYTFFVVHQRANDVDEGILAQDYPIPPGTYLLACSSIDQENWLFFGFGPLAGPGFGLFYSQHCSGGGGTTDSFVVGKTNVDEIVFSHAIGHRTFEDGVSQFVGNGTGDDLVGVSSPGHGIIGRGTNTFNDDRYRGQIAEIIGYSAGLTDPERQQIEAYLKRQWDLTF